MLFVPTNKSFEIVASKTFIVFFEIILFECHHLAKNMAAMGNSCFRLAKTSL
jgi:hypothetical protein